MFPGRRQRARNRSLNPRTAGPIFNTYLTHDLKVVTPGGVTPSFSRASGVSHIDHDGIVRYVASTDVWWDDLSGTDIQNVPVFSGVRMIRNLALYSEDLTQADWVAATGTPAETTFENDSGDPILQTITPGGSLTGRVFTLRIELANDDGDGSRDIDLVMSEGAGTAHTQTVTITDDPQVFSFVQTMVGDGDGTIDVGFYASDDAMSRVTYGSKIQVEEKSGASVQRPGEYVKTLDAIAVRFSDCVNGNTINGTTKVLTDTPGSPISNATVLGYHAHGPSAHIALHSEDLTQAATWVPSAVALTAALDAAVIQPDGRYGGVTKLAETGPGSGYRYISQTITGLTNNAPQTVSVFVKAGTSTHISISIYDATAASALIRQSAHFENGTSWQDGAGTGGGLATSGSTVGYTSIRNIGNGWAKISLTLKSNLLNSAHTNQFLIYPTGAGREPQSAEYLYVWGAQYEDNVKGPHPYVKTGAGTVAIAGAYLSYPSAGIFWPLMAKPWTVNLTTVVPINVCQRDNAVIWGTATGTADGTTGQVTSGGTTWALRQAKTGETSVTRNLSKTCTAFSQVTWSFLYDEGSFTQINAAGTGTTRTTAINGGVTPMGTTLDIGFLAGPVQEFTGWIKMFSVFPFGMPGAKMKPRSLYPAWYW